MQDGMRTINSTTGITTNNNSPGIYGRFRSINHKASINKELIGLIICCVLTANSSFLFSQILIGTTEVDTHSVATGLETPWEVLWGPDSHLWITERSGKVSRIDPITEEMVTILTLSDVHEESESGLLGMALHPDFPDTSQLFLAYNYYSGGIKLRIVRYTYTGTSLVDPLILLDNIGGAGNHDGSRIVIDTNYKLFVTTGDAQNTSNAQNLSSLNGKILRMNLNGSIPHDNPIDDSYLWTWGHRNPQGLIIAPDGKMYSSEHGPSNDDELNLIEKGLNYGWPDVQGFCNAPTEIEYCTVNIIREPLFAWTPTLAVAGIDFYGNDSIPEWKNNILMTTLKEKELISLRLGTDGETITGTSKWFDNWFGRLRDVCVAPDGRVFIAVSNRDGRGNPVPGDDRIVQISAKQEVPNPDGISNKLSGSKIILFPNPVMNTAIMTVADDLIGGNLNLYNISGQLIFSDIIRDNTFIFDREITGPGYYILNVVKNHSTGIISLVVM